MMVRGKKILLFLLMLGCFIGVQAKVVRVGVLLPLKDQSARGEKMIEFYRGFLLSADSLRQEGVTIELKTYHSGTSASEMDMLLATENLTKCDMIVGPLDVAQLPRLTDYCATHQIKLVVPFSSDQSQVGYYDNYYMVSAPRAVIQKEAIWFLSLQFANCQIVVVKTGEHSDEGNAFVELVKVNALQRGVAVKTVTMPCEPQDLEACVSGTRRNLFILDASSVKALNIAMPSIKTFKETNPEIEMCMLGYPQWQTFTSQFLRDFYALDTYIYTSFYAHPLDVNHKNLLAKYGHWFHAPMTMSFPCYGLMGFDIGYYFMRALHLYGADFDPTTDFVNTNAYQNSMWFEREADDKGLINHFVELVHYTPSQTIELVTRNR